jgi:uncharacterized protein YjbI with pentapeptide repeats
VSSPPRDLLGLLGSHRNWIKPRGVGHANLSNVNLSATDLSGAHLRFVSLQSACLSGASLREADLTQAWLGGADLTFANLQQVASILTCPRFDAPWADQTGSTSSPHMRIMRYGSCPLKPAVILAELRGAYLGRTDLRRANLTLADLTDADLTLANLTGAEGITNEQLQAQARALFGTVMPDGQKYEDWLIPSPFK